MMKTNYAANERLEQVCEWFLIATRQTNPEGKLRHCARDCDGFKFDCSEFISNYEIKNSKAKQGEYYEL